MNLKKLFFLLLLGIFIVFFDQVIKQYSFDVYQSKIERFPYTFHEWPVFENFYGISFYFSYLPNFGAAWGMLSDYQIPLLLARIVLVCAMVVYLLTSALNFWQSIAMTFIVSGAIGNIIDYFLYGHVVDMFHFIFFGLYRYIF